MMRVLSTILILATLMACSSAASTDPVADALEAVGQENYDEAQTICDGVLADSTIYNHLTSSQLCMLASIYVRLDGDNEANDASAARCLSRARNLATDSVSAFIASLPEDLAVRITILDRVGTYLGIPRDSLVSSEDLDGEFAADTALIETNQ
jgi:hypothetical protein